MKSRIRVRINVMRIRNTAAKTKRKSGKCDYLCCLFAFLWLLAYLFMHQTFHPAKIPVPYHLLHIFKHCYTWSVNIYGPVYRTSSPTQNIWCKELSVWIGGEDGNVDLLVLLYICAGARCQLALMATCNKEYFLRFSPFINLNLYFRTYSTVATRTGSQEETRCKQQQPRWCPR